jgi:hypothetical protein
VTHRNGPRTGAFATAPPAERPTTPGPSYGVPTRGGAMVEWSTVVDRLRAASAFWLATVTPSGRPHVVPIWGVFVRDDLYLEIGAPETAKARNLAANSAVGVHLDGVDDALIIFGTATHIRPGPALGSELAAAFHAKYPGYTPEPTGWDDGGLVRIEPATILAWREMPTATRWRFPPADD